VLRADRAKWRRLGHIRQAATELAFNKRRMARRGQDPEIQKEIDRYRQRLAALNAVAPRERAD
jgi:hypothetical protein